MQRKPCSAHVYISSTPSPSPAQHISFANNNTNMFRPCLPALLAWGGHGRGYCWNVSYLHNRRQGAEDLLLRDSLWEVGWWRKGCRGKFSAGGKRSSGKYRIRRCIKRLTHCTIPFFFCNIVWLGFVCVGLSFSLINGFGAGSARESRPPAAALYPAHRACFPGKGQPQLRWVKLRQLRRQQQH